MSTGENIENLQGINKSDIDKMSGLPVETQVEKNDR